MSFGEKMYSLRKKFHYTQDELAEILDVSRQAVSRWETDLAYPETKKLIQISKIFQCSIDYLLLY